MYHYWAQGRIVAVHRANPYVVTPAAYPHDPATAHVSEVWRSQPAPYGPAWEVAGTVAAPLRSARAAELVFRIVATLALLGCIGLVAARTRNPAAVVLLGWNPLLALHFAGGGHSDAVMMLLVLTSSVVLHYGFGDHRLWWSGPVHGFLYMGYLVATAVLGTSVRWRPVRMVLVALAGTFVRKKEPQTRGRPVAVWPKIL